MAKPNPAVSPKANVVPMPDRIAASVAMLDYLIDETRYIDPMCAFTLKVARMQFLEGRRA